MREDKVIETKKLSFDQYSLFKEAQRVFTVSALSHTT